MIESPAGPVGSLYVHVPFCAQKCAYCAFFSEPSNAAGIDRYVAALICELERVAADLRPQTVFFGGGTPSLLNLRQWEQILRAMDRLRLLGAVEWTVECNPATVSLDKARLLRDYGVNRVSLGVQSFDAALLERLGRIHSREMAFKSFDLLRKSGFDNVNLDLMFAIPGQTLDAWHSSLAEATAMASEHLSSYEVIYEEDTPFYAQLQAGKLAIDEDLACEMYEELVKRAVAAGFVQYEVANFARSELKSEIRNPKAEGSPKSEIRIAEAHTAWNPASSNQPPATRNTQNATGSTSPVPRRSTPLPSRACLHNVNYWRGGSFYGLGPSATGYIRGVRSKNWSNTERYCEYLESGQRAIESQEELLPLARAGETAAFGLRMAAGWGFEEFREITDYDLRDWGQEMRQLTECGWGQLSPDGFNLTSQGLRFADAAAKLFLR